VTQLAVTFEPRAASCNDVSQPVHEAQAAIIVTHVSCVHDLGALLALHAVWPAPRNLAAGTSCVVWAVFDDGQLHRSIRTNNADIRKWTFLLYL
jgi:hypothetical protein